jgi:hypothetical protein
MLSLPPDLPPKLSEAKARITKHRYKTILCCLLCFVILMSVANHSFCITRRLSFLFLSAHMIGINVLWHRSNPLRAIWLNCVRLVEIDKSTFGRGLGAKSCEMFLGIKLLVSLALFPFTRGGTYNSVDELPRINWDFIIVGGKYLIIWPFQVSPC